MYRVLIVEDEIIIRTWLRKSIDWKGCGLCVCGEAGNGRDALAIYEREKPDIILTDLRMPVMDGLTLLCNVRDQDKRVRFLILTCLDEFALVQQAVELDVTSYILKLTSEPDEIEKKLLKARDYLNDNGGSTKAVRQEVKQAQSLPQGQNRKIAAALSYLEKHYTEDISVRQAAEAIGVSPNYLGKLFKRNRGCSFTEELNKLRIQRAKELLGDPSYCIYKVAEMVGFFNTTYFFYVFKKYEGCTPTEYREGV